MSELINAAREWYDAGYCVVPTHEDGGKRPFGAWKQYQTERLPWEQLEALLLTGNYTGIGVLTGSASGNVEMIEIEGPLDLALKRLAKVKAQARDYAQIGLPDLLQRLARSCAEQSAGGGLHLFYRVSDGPALGNTKLAHADGKVIAETRGEGGFVVVAPTPGRNGHPEGSAYSLLNACTPAGTITVTSEERDLLHLLFSIALDEEPTPQDPYKPAGAAGDSTSALDDYRARHTWAEILQPQGWTFSHHADGRDHWVRPGKSIHEGTSATTIEDGPFFCFSTSTTFPSEQGLSKGQVYAYLHHGGDLSKASRQLAADGYGTQAHHVELPAWEAELDPDASDDERADAQGAWVAENLPVLDWHEVWANQTEEEWIVEPLLARRRLVALYSAPKVGKSLLMLEIAAAIASGCEVLGSKPPEPIRTLYVDFENDPRGDVRERLQDMGYAPDQLANLCYLSFPNLGKLDTERGAKELLAAVAHYRCEVVVVDTVSRSVEGDENENDTWLSFYRHTGLKLKQAKVALIRLDHSGKDEKRGQRGGSAKSGDVDAVWRLSRQGGEDSDTFDLVCEAQRFPIQRKKLTIRREVDPLRHEVSSDPYMDARARLFTLFRDKKVPKDRNLSVNNARALAREMCGKVPNFDKATWLAWCQEAGQI
jgi:hypothetical protein